MNLLLLKVAFEFLDTYDLKTNVTHFQTLYVITSAHYFPMPMIDFSKLITVGRCQTSH
jgi:hypothetical protein